MGLNLCIEDIEIENSKVGPIIHIFPHEKPNKASVDIIKGLSLLELIENFNDDVDLILENKDIDENMKKTYEEIKNKVRDTLVEAENNAVKYFEESSNNKILDPEFSNL